MTGASPTFRVASWNIRAAIGPGEPFPSAWWRHVDSSRLERIAAIVSALDADVVALQEVAVFNADGHLVDQPTELAQRTGMHVRYGAVHAYPLATPDRGRPLGTAMWGNAILSRQPLDRGFAVGLPTGGDAELVEAIDSHLPMAGVPYARAEAGVREPRCAVGGHLVVRGLNLSIVNAHLTYAGTGQRRAQAGALAQTALDLGTPVIVAGDFNAPVESMDLGPLTSAFDDPFSAIGIKAGDPRRASCAARGIDHLLVRHLRTIDCRVDPGAGSLSDHLPVVGTFEP